VDGLGVQWLVADGDAVVVGPSDVVRVDARDRGGAALCWSRWLKTSRRLACIQFVDRVGHAKSLISCVAALDIYMTHQVIFWTSDRCLGGRGKRRSLLLVEGPVLEVMCPWTLSSACRSDWRSSGLSGAKKSRLTVRHGRPTRL